VADDDSATSDDIDTNGYVFGSLSTAGFVGIVIGGVAVIILAVGVMMIVRKRRKRKLESSSTGLIEEDE
jgi:preprotein translocase subunit SecF